MYYTTVQYSTPQYTTLYSPQRETPACGESPARGGALGPRARHPLTLTIYYTTVQYTTVYYTTLHYTTVYYTTLPTATDSSLRKESGESGTLDPRACRTLTLTIYYTTVQYSTPQYTTLHYSILHYTPHSERLQPAERVRREGARWFLEPANHSHWQYTTLQYSTPQYTTLHYTTLQYTTLHSPQLQTPACGKSPARAAHWILEPAAQLTLTIYYTTVQHSTPQYTTLHYTTLQYTTLHSHS